MTAVFQNDYDRLLEYTIRNGGGTFGIVNLCPLTDMPVYVLSFDDERGEVHDLADVSTTTVTLFIEKHRNYIETYNVVTSHQTIVDSDHPLVWMKAVGTWIDDDKLYLDVVSLVPVGLHSREEMCERGRAAGQRAIYDMSTGEVFDTGLTDEDD